MAGPGGGPPAAAAGGAEGAAPEAYAFVDLEQDLRDPELEGAARARGCRVIRSCLTCAGCPPTWPRACGAWPGPRAGAGSCPRPRWRCAARATSGAWPRPSASCGAWRRSSRPMGEYGTFSRILAGKLGSWLACCSPGRSRTTPRSLVELYRFRRSARTRPCTGWSATPSPTAARRTSTTAGLRGPGVGRGVRALPGRRPGGVPARRRGAGRARLVGDRAVQGAGAAAGEAGGGGGPAGKTALFGRRRGGPRGRRGQHPDCWRPASWRAANTDVAGFLAPLERVEPGGKGRLLPCRRARRRLHSRPRPPALAVVLGAGGAARAVVHALTRARPARAGAQPHAGARARAGPALRVPVGRPGAARHRAPGRAARR